MKKSILTIFKTTFIISIFLLTTISFGQYTLTDNDVDVVNGVITKNYYRGGGHIIIPSTLVGQKITKIGYNSFEVIDYSDPSITNITFPNTLKEIESNAFYQNIDNDVTIELNHGFKILQDSAFSNNDFNLILPNSITYIGAQNVGHNAGTTIPYESDSIGYIKEWFTYSADVPHDKTDWLNLDEVTLTNDQTTQIGFDLAYRANYTPITYSISYFNTDSENYIATYTIESENIELPTPNKEGFMFDGWYLEQSFSSKLENISTGSFGDKTLYAKFSEVTTSLLEQFHNFKIYPNPSQNYIYIEGTSINSINIYSVSGDFTTESVINSKIDISHYDNGIYTIIINNKPYKVVKK